MGKAAKEEKFSICVCSSLNRNWKSFSDDEVDYFSLPLFELFLKTFK